MVGCDEGGAELTGAAWNKNGTSIAAIGSNKGNVIYFFKSISNH